MNRSLNIPVEVLARDPDWYVLAKPAGLVVNRSETQTGSSLEDWLGAFDERLQKVLRHGIVHRLDKETSGVLLVARSEVIQQILQSQFARRLVKKEYLALLHGTLDHPVNVDAPLGRNPKNPMRFIILPQGRTAQTAFHPMKTFVLSAKVPDWYTHFTLCHVVPRTGRTHQIRVHAKSIEHPVVSDTLYAGRKRARLDRSFCPRLFLHAHKLTFLHPKLGTPVTVTAPLPEDLTRALDYLTG